MRIYVIINSSDVDGVDFSKVLQTSEDTLRYSLDGTKAVLKFEGDTPSFLIGEPQYTHAEILSILSGPEWTDPEVEL
jgi:hypothetical protein